MDIPNFGLEGTPVAVPAMTAVAEVQVSPSETVYFWIIVATETGIAAFVMEDPVKTDDYYRWSWDDIVAVGSVNAHNTYDEPTRLALNQIHAFFLTAKNA